MNNDLIQLILGVITTLSTGGFFVSSRLRKKERAKFDMEMREMQFNIDEKQRKSVQQVSKDLLDKYQEYIVSPLTSRVTTLEQKFRVYERAFSTIKDCSHSANCPVVDYFLSATKGNNIGNTKNWKRG